MPIRLSDLRPPTPVATSAMRDLRVFDTFEIGPCTWEVDVMEGIVDYERIEEIDIPRLDHERIVWTVYGHYDSSIADLNVLGRITSLCDCEDRPTAILIAKLLEDHRYCERKGI